MEDSVIQHARIMLYVITFFYEKRKLNSAAKGILRQSGQRTCANTSFTSQYTKIQSKQQKQVLWGAIDKCDNKENKTSRKSYFSIGYSSSTLDRPRQANHPNQRRRCVTVIFIDYNWLMENVDY